jgi:hypothetical protein
MQSSTSTTTTSTTNDEMSAAVISMELRALMQELASVRDQMKRMGADDDYKRAYFRQCIGHCEETRGSSCVRHRHAPRKLPAGLFCAVEKKECLRELRLRLQFVDSKMQAYKQQWEDLKVEETSDGFLAGDGDVRAGEKRKVS